jgi:hypothetical protein
MNICPFMADDEPRERSASLPSDANWYSLPMDSDAS